MEMSTAACVAKPSRDTATTNPSVRLRPESLKSGEGEMQRRG